MKIKSFLLALIAASMTLAGCGKDDKTSEEPQEPAPSETVEPSGETDQTGGGGSDTDPSKEEDQDKLTPAQRESATSIQNTVKLVLSLTNRYDEATINGIDEYTLAYSEEVALEDICFNDLGPAIIGIMTLDTSDAEAIVDFVIKLKKNDLLDEASYVAVAAGKSFLRAESAVNEDFGETLVYAADYLDKEGAELHKNVYAFLDSIVGCASVFMSKEFSDAVNSVYDAEENQVSYEKVCEVITSAGSALTEFSSGYESASYLANLLVEGLEGYAQEDLELEEETEEFEEEFDIQSVIDSIYTATSMAGLTLSFLPSMEGNPIPHVVELINLALAKEYAMLVMSLVDDFMLAIGIETDTWLMGLMSLGSVIMSIPRAIENIAGYLSEDIVDEETGKYSAELMQAIVVACAEEIEELATMSQMAIAFDEFLMLVVNKTLATFADYEEDEAAIVAAKFDVTGKIEEIYGGIANVGAAIASIDDELYVVAAHLLNEEYEDAISALLVYIGYEGKLEDVEEDFGIIAGAVMAIYGHFSSDEFAAELVEVYNVETGEIDLEKAKAIIVEVADTLSIILEVKENVLNLGDFVIAALKLTLIKCGMDEKEAEELFANFDVEEFVNFVFKGIETVVDTIYDVGATEKFDVYLTLVKDLAEIFLGEEEKEWDEEFSEVVAVLCAFIGEFFEIEPAKMESVESALNTPVKINEIVELVNTYAGSGEGSFLDFFTEIDPETGTKTVKEMSVTLIVFLVSALSNSFADLANDWIVTVEVFEEVVGKVSEDADLSAQCAELKAFFGSIQSNLMSVYNYLSDYENTMTLVAKIVSYGNLALEGAAIVEEIKEGYIDTYKLSEYVCRVVSMFVEAEHNEYEITSFDEIDGVVAEALPMEEIAACIEAGESNVFEDSEAVIGLKEDEGVYYIEVTLVSHYEVEIVEGEIVSTSIEVEVYAFAVPGLELLAQLLPGQEAVEVVPVEG